MFETMRRRAMGQLFRHPRAAHSLAWKYVTRRSLLLEPLEDRNLPSFVAPLNYDTGPDTIAVAVGDFNGDGIPDLVALNRASLGGTPSLSVFLGNGDGSFRPGVTSASVAQNSSTLLVADFNHDGWSDVLATAPDGRLAVYLSNGDGTFRPPREFSGNTLRSPVVADVDGDGIPDLIGSTGGGVSVLLGTGDGNFGPPTNYSLPVGLAQSVVVGDFVGDGTVDIVARDSGNAQHRTGLNVLAGNGDGTFRPPIRTEDQTNYFGPVVAADFNHDNRMDLAYQSGTDVIVQLNNGGGSFQPPVRYPLGSAEPGSLVVVDLNGDGNPDLVVPSSSQISSSQSVLKVLLGNGDGTFRTVQNLFVGSDLPPSVAFADLNGDGLPDLVMPLGDHGVGVRLATPDGTFQSAPRYVMSAPAGKAVGDFTGHGVLDIAVANNKDNGTVNILRGNGDGTFQSIGTFATAPHPSEIVTGDFNGDHILDLAVVTDVGLQLFLGNGDGTFQAPALVYADPDLAQVVVADFNGDGNLDLVVMAESGVRLLLGNGNGTFQAPALILNSFGTLAVGDFNGDHRPDLAVLDPFSGSVRVLLGNGNGTFQPVQTYSFGRFPGYGVAAADLNGDGHDDLVITSSNSDQFLPGFVSVLLSNADGTFQPAVNYQVGNFDPGSVVVAAFRGDSRRDIAVLEENESASVRILLGNGDGTFQIDPFGYALGSGVAVELAVGDFNGDGFPDLVATNIYDNSISVLMNGADWSASQTGARGSHAWKPISYPFDGALAKNAAEFADVPYASPASNGESSGSVLDPTSSQRIATQRQSSPASRLGDQMPARDRLFANAREGLAVFSFLLKSRDLDWLNQDQLARGDLGRPE